MSDDSDFHLFIPGPAGSTPEVLEASGRPIEPHYGPRFVAAYNRCIELFQQIFVTENDLFLIVGPGTASLDAAIGSALPDGSRVLVLANGWFGYRMGEMCESHRCEVDVLEFPIGSAVDPAAVRERLATDSYQAVAWVHHETSTGVLNPVREVAAAAREHGALTIIDAVSSLGGAELRIDDWGVDLCASVANKCLGAPPGLSAITVSDAAWKAIDANPGSRSWYLDLRVWRRYRNEWADWHPFPTTVGSTVVDAITVSLEQILAEGLDVRLQRTADAASTVRNRLRGMGFEMFVDDDAASPVTTSVYAHPQLSAADLVTYLAERKIYISGGLADLRGKIFRIGHMGTSIEPAEVELLLSGIEGALRQAGVEVAEEVNS